MTTHNTVKGLFDSVRNTLPYKVERLILEFTEQLSERIKVLGLSRTGFASKLETSPAYVTKLLAGSTNFTLESMVKAADALDSDIRVDLVPRVPVTVWIQIMEKSCPPPKAELQIWSQWKRRNQAGENNDLIGPRFVRRTCSYPEEMYNY
jgi:hypothetical protein